MKERSWKSHNPHQGGITGKTIEGSESSMPEPSRIGGSASDDGDHDQSAHAAFNASHGRPAPQKTASNQTGKAGPGDPTAAEGL